MSGDNQRPVRITRKRIIMDPPHHSGAWKVAYADFVTAMMAFFLLMWLINATSEKQRRGIAQYFNPEVPLHHASSLATRAPNSVGVLGEQSEIAPTAEPSSPQAQMESDQAALAALNSHLRAIGGESAEMERLLRHVVSKISDEGLVIEVFDLPDSPLFDGRTAKPMPLLGDLAGVIVRVVAKVRNDLAVQGHVQSYPVMMIENPAWPLSAARAQEMRHLLTTKGLAPERLQRVSGFADRKLLVEDPMAARNNRLEVILLRRK